MFIELTCHSCGKTFFVDFTKNELVIDKCPHCKTTVTDADAAHIAAMTESFYANCNRITAISVNKIQTGAFINIDSNSNITSIFDADIQNLSETYYSATPDVQEKLTALVDKLFLLVNHDAKNGCVDTLDATLDQLRNLFMRKVKLNHQQMEQELGLEGGETENA